MSIHDEINARVIEKRLYPLERSLKSDAECRHMFMADEIRILLDGPWNHDDLRYRAGRLRADLEDFIKGAELSVCLEPFVAKTAYMGRLSPVADGIWDIRSRDPSPALRVVGGFAEKDVFVALRWGPRSKRINGTTKPPLGPKDSREWRDIIVQCGTDWRNLFHTYAPVTGDNLDDYFSDRAHVV
jgi:hypothetical protein